MSDNPFSEPEDNDRTVIRPSPGGRRNAAAPPLAQPSDPRLTATRPPDPRAYEPRGGEPRRSGPASDPPPADRWAATEPVSDVVEVTQAGLDPLLLAASPLLQLLARLRNTVSQPDAGDLRERAVREIRLFEQRCREGNIPMEQLRTAHYALCASLDDAVLNTPWGSSGSWDARSLVSTFHEETRSGERFFVLLDQVKQNAGKFLPVLELMYLCLALGFQGRYRLSPRGPGELEKLREEIYALIQRNRPAPEPDLSPKWQGITAPYRPARASVPVWVVASAALAVVAGLFVWVSSGLNAASDDLFERMLAAQPDHMPAIARSAPVLPPPPPPAPAEPDVLDKLRTFLKPEIDQGLVTVLGTPSTPIVRIHNRGMFPSGSATVQPAFLPLLQRIGTALKAEDGSVNVIGYTDNQPIRTIQFPSNFQLSTARAQAAKAIVAQTIGDSGRITAEGRADAEPVGPNTTPDGREQNRRIEIVLHRPQ